MRNLDVQVGDRLIMKKKHPCGSNEFAVLRSGMDFRLKCCGCGREVMVPRIKIAKKYQKVIGTKTAMFDKLQGIEDKLAKINSSPVRPRGRVKSGGVQKADARSENADADS